MCMQAYFDLDDRITIGAYDAYEASLAEASQNVSDGPGTTMLRVRLVSQRRACLCFGSDMAGTS